MNRFLLLLPVALFGLLVWLFFAGIGREDKDVLPSPLINKPFPAFVLQQVESETEVNASEHQEPAKQLTQDDLIGEPMLVNVWATWCPTCKAEHEFLNTLAAQGTRIIGINYKDEEALALKWLEDFGNPYEFNISDPDGMLGLELGVYGAPETFLVDGNGIIRAKHVGDLNPRVWQKYQPQFALMQAAANQQPDDAKTDGEAR